MKRAVVALTSVLLVAFAQSVLAQSAIETARAATVTIVVAGPDGQSHGSGFVVSSDGLVVTAAHVIEGATSAIVRFPDGEELNVEGVVAIDRAKDFAIVRVAGFDLPTVPLGDADDVSVGQRVIAIGAPAFTTLAGTVSDGLISSERIRDGTRMLQISVPVSPGSSGGPVMTEQGEVIGLVVSSITADDVQNLNFALPINYVRGRLALAATQPLQALAEVPATTSARVTASAGATVPPTIPTPVLPRSEDELVFQGETYLDRRTMEPYSGPIVKYHPGGRRVYHSFTLRNGKIDGLYERYFLGGELSRKQNYTDGRLDGPFETHHENGQLRHKGVWNMGELEGPWEEYHPNGQLEARGTVNMGEMCGEWIYGDGDPRTYDPCPPGLEDGN
jgi:serine protease Do